MPVRTLLFLFLFFLPIASWAKRCDECGTRIRKDYYTVESNDYCSKGCVRIATAPMCATCDSRVGQNYVKSGDVAYCDRQCFAKALPKCEVCKKNSNGLYDNGEVKFCKSCYELPRCFSCFSPVLKGKKTTDGRHYCRKCMDGAIFSKITAEEIYQKAQIYHTRLTMNPPKSIPPMQLLWPRDIQAKKPDVKGKFSLRGLYEWRSQILQEVDQHGHVVSEKVLEGEEMIYLVNGLKRNELIVTAVHELTHDWLRDYFPGLKKAPLMYEEGLCQYMAHTLCLKFKWRRTAKNIATSKDKVYGDGFRYFYKMLGPDNWKGAVEWMRSKGYDN